MSDLLDLAEAIAREAGALQRDEFGGLRQIETKSSSIDLVTDVDRASDTMIRDRIRRARPDDSILLEETGEIRAAGGRTRWIVDPLDGTTNYAHGVPHFAVSIGIEVDGRREAGVIYDPIKDEIFRAERGGGATLNGSPIRVSKVDSLERALLATGFAYSVHQGEIENLVYFERFMRRAQAIRRPGSAALDLAYVAAGRFDGFWEMHLQAWDVAAGLLLVEEAGGTLSDFDGSPAPASGARVVASNSRLHAAMLEVLA